jgi:guanylate kinase
MPSMQLEDLYLKLKKEKPPLIYLSGKTCTGKSTFANRLEASLGYEIAELDSVVFESVIKPLGLTDERSAFAEVYRNDHKREWIEPFVKATQRIISERKNQGQPIVVDGAVANINTIAAIFQKYPDFQFVYFHPYDLDIYSRNLTSRFMLATKDYNSGLPKRFWALIDDKAFSDFCKTHILTDELRNSIHQYAVSSREESEQRLAAFREKFKQVVVINV